MSTIFFGADELGKLAVMTVGNTASDTGKLYLAELCSSLAKYSEANAEAWSVRYGEECEANTADEILKAAKAAATIWGSRGSRTIMRRNCTSASLLRYNLDDCATVEALHAVVSVLSSEQFRVYSDPGVRSWK